MHSFSFGENNRFPKPPHTSHSISRSLTFEKISDLHSANNAFNKTKEELVITTQRRSLSDLDLKYFTLKFHLLIKQIERIPIFPGKQNVIGQIQHKLDSLKEECAKRDVHLAQVRIGKPIGTDYSYLSHDQLMTTTYKVYKLAAQLNQKLLISKLEAIVSQKPIPEEQTPLFKTTTDELNALRQEMRIRCIQLYDIPNSDVPYGVCETAPTQTDDELVSSIEQLSGLIARFYRNFSKKPLPLNAIAVLKQAKEELDKAEFEHFERQRLYQEFREEL